MKDKKVLIIGGAGFLGKRILHFLEEEGCNCYYADLQPIFGLNDTYISLNALSNTNFSKLDTDFDVVVNLTGQVSNPSNLCLQLNTEGINNIINFVNLSNAKLIQVSTLSVYGSSLQEVDENSPLNPETTYGSLKSISEYLLKNKLSEKKYAVIRLSNLYGDMQPKGIMSYLLRSVKNNDDIFFNNDGSLKRHYLNVDDAAIMIVKMCLQFNCGTYNYPGSDLYSIKELISLLEEISSKKLSVNYQNVKSWENLEKLNSSKIIDTFKYVPQKLLKTWLTKQL